jgi:hypothetical protein
MHPNGRRDFPCLQDSRWSSQTAIRSKSLNGNGVGWLGGNLEPLVPWVKYVVKISHKGLLFGSYSDYQKELSDKVLALRDREGFTFKSIADKLILEGYRSPRGFDLGPESVFSIYKKRKVRDVRMNESMKVEVIEWAVEDYAR